MVECPMCLKTFSNQGYRSHQGSLKCFRDQKFIYIEDEIKKKKDNLISEGYVPLSTYAALALVRRKAQNIAGLRTEETRLIKNTSGYTDPNEEDYWVFHEWWCYKWLYSIYIEFLKKDTTKEFYSIMEELVELEDKEHNQELNDRINMFILEALPQF